MSRTEIEGYNEKYPAEYLFDYLSTIFKMGEKTPKQKLIEIRHEREWKASGVKSWKELFNID